MLTLSVQRIAITWPDESKGFKLLRHYVCDSAAAWAVSAHNSAFAMPDGLTPAAGAPCPNHLQDQKVKTSSTAHTASVYCRCAPQQSAATWQEQALRAWGLCSMWPCSIRMIPAGAVGCMPWLCPWRTGLPPTTASSLHIAIAKTSTCIMS